jgi:hypothetical protein
MSLRYPVAISGFVAMFLDDGAETDGAVGPDVPLATISHGPAAFGAATWFPLHPARESTSAASAAPIGKGVFNTRSVLNGNQAAIRSARAFSACW